MATAVLVCRTARKRSAQARSWKPGRRRQPSGARERWKPARGETRAARLDAQHDSATGYVSWPETPMQLRRCSVDLRWWKNGLCGFGIAAPTQPGRRSCRGAKRSAAGIARRAFPWSASRSAQAHRAVGVRDQSRMVATRHVARGIVREPGGGTPGRSTFFVNM